MTGVDPAPGAANGQAGTCEHVCWLAGDYDAYRERAAGLLADAARRGDKAVAFGPPGPALEELAATAGAAVVAPAEALGGELDPAAVLRLVRGLADQARAGGHGGLVIVADMDWLLPLHPSARQVASLELQLDRLAAELDVTVACAYRPSSVEAGTLATALCVHPAHRGAPQPQFRFTAAPGGWQLSGEVDLQVAAAFEAALSAATALGGCVIDATGLRFIDVAGMRALARSAPADSGDIWLHGASPELRWHWDLCGFASAALAVRLAA